jgi:hypothetical protein
LTNKTGAAGENYFIIIQYATPLKIPWILNWGQSLM